jgi:hypothetical protein
VTNKFDAHGENWRRFVWSLEVRSVDGVFFVPLFRGDLRPFKFAELAD